MAKPLIKCGNGGKSNTLQAIALFVFLILYNILKHIFK